MLCAQIVYFLIAFYAFVPFMDAGLVPTGESVSYSETTAVAGGVAKLMCNVTPPIDHDNVYLVIWYKEGLKSPIYSYDGRDKSSEGAAHYADEKTVGHRVSFEIGTFDYPARLTLQAVKDSDKGLYRCRVDFKKSPTRNSNVNLTVILPPESLSIINEKGDHIPNYILGPYPEGSSVNITCIATGGRPLPRVTWWQDNTLLDEKYERLADRQVGNILRIEHLERKHLNAVYTCQASNNNLVVPISSAVTLDMILRPLQVKILGENKPLSAGSKNKITCQVLGARPTPRISWWKGNVMLRTNEKAVSVDGNLTTSSLTFVPNVNDHAKLLSCRVEPHHLIDNKIPQEDSWKLNIHHVPIVSVQFARNVNGSTIKEGIDVYFECTIKSNPSIYKVHWRHNGKVISNNPNMGILINNQSLLLQRVTRAQSGLYTCVGSNQEGDGESNPLQLDVKYIPMCRPGQELTYGVGREETVSIPCEIEANPSNVTFMWKFNNSTIGYDTVGYLKEQLQFTVEGTRSLAKFTPMGQSDYGMLLCWAKNELGLQIEPCVYHIIPAGRPDSLANCTMVNQTYDTLKINCEGGFDGGLPQQFAIEVYNMENKKLMERMTFLQPSFVVSQLTSGMEYEIKLYAFNSKGMSKSFHMQAFTLKSPQKHTGITPSEMSMKSFIGLLLGLAISVLALACIIVLISIRCRSKKKHSKTQIKIQNNESIDSGERDPDIIPHNTEEYLDEDEKAFERINNKNYCQRSNGCTTITRDSNKLIEDITYAKLDLPPLSINPNDGHFHNTSFKVHKIPPIEEEPIIYAQIENSLKTDAEISQETPLLTSLPRESMV